MGRMDDWERWQLAGAEAFWSLEERLDHAEAHSEGTTEGQGQEQGGEEVTVTSMTAAEFKNWLDGFMEGRGGRLTQKDVKRIQAQAGSVIGGCGCYHPYPYHQWPYSPWTWTTTPTIFSGTTSVGNDSTDCTPTTTVTGNMASTVGTTFVLGSGSTGNGLDTTSMCSG